MARATHARPRQPGRPRLTTGPDLRARALDAALDLFSTRGIAATSLRDIARATGVTPALLHYYFGSKPQLVEILIAERLMPVVGQMREAMQQAAGESAALVAGFVNALSTFIAVMSGSNDPQDALGALKSLSSSGHSQADASNAERLRLSHALNKTNPRASR